MNSIIKFVCASALAATSTSALFTATVHAQTAESFKLSIKTADLDLSSPDGQQRLLRRIDFAAKDVCGVDLATRDLRVQRAANNCVSTVRSQALAQVKTRDGQPLALNTTK